MPTTIGTVFRTAVKVIRYIKIEEPARLNEVEWVCQQLVEIGAALHREITIEPPMLITDYPHHRLRARSLKLFRAFQAHLNERHLPPP
ncbi:MAG: hypothetical protein HY437_00910 [Candidatus Magasanikbacteria bacterium]|nr:hypothetical protein [Candidatus Magasanikbacteria bacterium]